MLVISWVLAGVVLLVAAATGYLAYQTLLQNGRILLRIERLEEETRVVREALDELANEPAAGTRRAPIAGWAPGTVVPDFELPTADSETVTLWEWKGREVLLVFIDPRCPFSRSLLDRMERLRVEEAGPVTLLISAGPHQDTLQLRPEAGSPFRVLFQEEREVARLLRADGTPAAYRISASGRTVGERALGEAAVWELLRHGMFGPAEDPDHEPAGLGDDFTPLHFPPIPTRTRIRRTGLHPGEPAPNFRLLDLDGVERSLADYLGRPLLLVFTDPQCAPCRQVLPELERIHRAGADQLCIVAISRGGAEANRDHARHVTFPLLLQRQWEISRAYAMFATPIAYLIDESGTIASRPAAGGPAILELVEHARFAVGAGAVSA